ncbi:MAG: hypothetical protein C5B50_04005, partial [Verrucomicrobia bacterium]
MKENRHHSDFPESGSFGRHAIVLLISVLVTTAVFWQLRRAQLSEFRSQFESEAAACTALIRQETDKSLLAVKSLGWFIDGTVSLDARSFQAFVAGCLPDRKELQALSWNPRVSASERLGFEQQARWQGLNQFQITEKGPDGPPVTAGAREAHYPVFYIAPLHGNETAVGFDVASEPVRRAALERARDTGQPAVTEPIRLVQQESESTGFLIFVPVYGERLPQAAIEQRRASLKGFAVGVYEAGAVVSAALRGVEPRGLGLTFLDRTAAVGRQEMYRWDHPLKANHFWKSILFPSPPKVTGTFGFAGRDWSVEVLAGPAYMERYCPISYWLVLPAGLLLGLLTTSSIGAVLRKEADEALRESQARYRAVVENSPDGIGVSIDNKVVYANPAAVRLAGARSAADLLGRSVAEFVHEDYRAEVERRRLKILETGLPSPVMESKLRRADGTIIVAESTGVPILYAGKPAVLNSFRDITEHKQAQRLLAGEKCVLEGIALRKPLPEVLCEICRFIDELSPGVMSSILLLDPDGTHLRPIAAPRLPEEWSRAITPLAIGPAVGSCGTAAWDKEQVIVSDIATDPRWTGYPEFCALALKSDLRACWSTPILSAEGAPLGTFAMYYQEPRSPSPGDLNVIRQVTHLASIAIEHHRAAEAVRRARDELEQRVQERTVELVQANQRLEELDRLKSQFLATMSHELRTPLNSIIGFTSILRKGFAGPVNEEQHKELGMVFGSAKHLLSLINDLLDLSRIEAGKVEIESEPFNFVEVIEEVVQNLTPLAGQKKLRLATELPGPAIEMVGDRKRSYQVLLNLANNAVKFTDRGEVKISAQAGPDQLRVCVADTGIGIKPEQMGMLFEAFRQLDGTARRVYEGTGLGLHLCRRLLTLMRGEIGVESEFGKGSRFTFTLPRHNNGQP